MIKPVSSGILVKFITVEPQWELPRLNFLFSFPGPPSALLRVCEPPTSPQAYHDTIWKATVFPLPSSPSSGSSHNMGPSEPPRKGPGCPQATPHLGWDYGLCFSFFHTALGGTLSEDTLEQEAHPQGPGHAKQTGCIQCHCT